MTPGRTEEMEALKVEVRELRQRRGIAGIIQANPVLATTLATVLTTIAASTFGINLGGEGKVTTEVSNAAALEATAIWRAQYGAQTEHLGACREALDDARDSLRLCADRLAAHQPGAGFLYEAPAAAEEAPE